MRDKRKRRPTRDGKLGDENKMMRRNDNTKINQRARILAWFDQSSPRLSTIDSRERLGIMSLAPRIMELRRQGHKITTEWVTQRDVTGTTHRNGIYVYGGSRELNENTT